jgi:hypothetical protein
LGGRLQSKEASHNNAMQGSGMKISDLQIDSGTQVRVKIHEDAVADYSEAMNTNSKFPPIIVFHDGSGYFVGDGFHRILAAVRIGREDIAADIRKGTATDALWFALGANKENGIRLNPADKKHAILLALKMWPERSSTMIAEQIGCSQSWIMRIKEQVSTSTNLPTRVTGKDGKSYPAKRKTAITKEKRIDKIKELTSQGFTAAQIASEIGVGKACIVEQAKKEEIKLTDAMIGRVRKIDINRIIGETANAAESLASGLEFINGKLDGLDLSKVANWISVLRKSVNALNGLIAKLKRSSPSAE